MPTNTTSPSSISRAAAATISSAGVKAARASVAIVHRGRQGMLLQLQPGRPLRAEQAQIVVAAVHAIYPARLPGGEFLRRLALALVAQIGLVVAVVVPGHRRGMRPPRRVDDGADAEAGRDHPVRIRSEEHTSELQS